MGESHLIKALESEIHFRTINSERRKKVRIGIFDSDTNTKIKDKEDYNVFSFKIEPNGISTEFLFVEDDIKKEVNGLRLFIGTEFDNKSTRHISEKLNLGVDSSKRAGKNEIIDLDVFDEKNQNKALSKEKFAQAVFEGDISISSESWQNFRHIFKNIENYLIKQDK